MQPRQPPAGLLRGCIPQSVSVQSWKSCCRLTVWGWEYKRQNRAAPRSASLVPTTSLFSTQYGAGFEHSLSLAHGFRTPASPIWILSSLTNLLCILSIRGNSNSIVPVLSTYLYRNSHKFYNPLTVAKGLTVYRGRDSKTAQFIYLGSQAKTSL